MPTKNSTNNNSKSEVNISTQKTTTIELTRPGLEILVGGPYQSNGENHTYGHVALKVTTNKDEHVFDFGRYNGESGPYGQGRLRVWTKFSKYIAGENATTRITTGFFYFIGIDDANNINAHFKNLVGTRPVLKAYGDYMKEYRLANDYHALNNNCTTTAMTGARIAIKDLDHDVSKFNKGDGMSGTEQFAAKMAGWPNTIFMPADLRKMLETNSRHKADKISQYGGKK